MKAIRFHEYGGPEVLRFEDAPTPVTGAGEVRIRVAGSAVNPVDDGIRGGYLREAFPLALPHVPGADVSGTVDAVGDGVSEMSVGDAVVGFLPMQADGSAAEYVVAPADVLSPAPRNLPLADAAALPSVALTAWQALFDHAGLTSGQRVLVNGAGGAVGGYVVQLARWTGAHVIATASPRSVEGVRAAGAHEVLDHTTIDVAAALTDPVDVLVNLAPVDPAQLAALTAHVVDGGVVVNTVPMIPTTGDDARGVRGVGLFVRSDAAQLARLVELVEAGTLHVDVSERLPLSELGGVHARLAAGTVTGKVVVQP